jgi:hypothetical protein
MSDDPKPQEPKRASDNAQHDPPAHRVGYGSPPLHSRFKKNESGNPRGRPKGARGLKRDIAAMLDQPVRLSDGRSMTTQQATLAALRAKALKGDFRACEKLLALADQHAAELDAKAPATAPLSEADRAVIEAALKRRAKPEGEPT